MVTGTAWFAISLANIRRKFEDFGVHLTMNMFQSFVGSLVILGLLTVYSFLAPLLTEVAALGNNAFIFSLSVVFGILAVGSILWKMLAGSLQYDINDAMLTGQSESAQKFYKRSLSLLYKAAKNLRTGKDLEVANYYLGVSFNDIFQFVRSKGVLNVQLEELIRDTKHLKSHPNLSQEAADRLSLKLIESFLHYCVNVQGQESKKCIMNIQEELQSLKAMKASQAIVDTRMSFIFEEIAELLELQGETLFRKTDTPE